MSCIVIQWKIVLRPDMFIEYIFTIKTIYGSISVNFTVWFINVEGLTENAFRPLQLQQKMIRICLCKQVLKALLI